MELKTKLNRRYLHKGKREKKIKRIDSKAAGCAEKR
jgi:hypothetical protein